MTSNPDSLLYAGLVRCPRCDGHDHDCELCLGRGDVDEADAEAWSRYENLPNLSVVPPLDDSDLPF